MCKRLAKYPEINEKPWERFQLEIWEGGGKLETSTAMQPSCWLDIYSC